MCVCVLMSGTNQLDFLRHYWHLAFTCAQKFILIFIVQCENNGTIRLVGGANEKEGRVEVCMGGYWGTVCSDGWSEEDALVVCRQAGYDTLSELHFSRTLPKVGIYYVVNPSYTSRARSID